MGGNSSREKESSTDVVTDSPHEFKHIYEGGHKTQLYGGLGLGVAGAAIVVGILCVKAGRKRDKEYANS